ncbi:MAG TPA: polyprenyl synthetase family protein [Candidatus Nitrosotalea sp.]|nr:polyprenyl synthetase family protein [Candidatus Nitrosotalea sp.]
MKMESIVRDTRKIDTFLLSRLKGQPENLYKAASYLIEHGGKRLRPYLVIKSCQLVGGSVRQATPAASAIEMVHNFTLVHDDIMDNDEMRHGVPTTHKKFGIPVSILAGDLLFSKAFETISHPSIPRNVGISLVSALSKSCTDVCEGQVLDISMAASKKIPTESEYTRMIEKKTSSLFIASCAMGAISANTTKADVARLSTYGKNLGIGFQIIDDLIGIIGDPKITKKPVGNDIREGKKSLPILLAIKTARGQEKRAILRAFGRPSAPRKDVERAVEAISSLGIETTVRKKASHHLDTARHAISRYDSPAREDLLSLLDFVVERSL